MKLGNIVNNSILTIAVLALGLASSGCTGESFGEKMVRESEENTKKLCPMEVDDFTMLDSMSFDIEKHTLTYYYSLHEALDYDSLYSDDVVAAHRNTLIKDIKNSVTLKDVKKEKVNFTCIYLSASTGKTLLKYEIQAKEYASEGKQ